MSLIFVGNFAGIWHEHPVTFSIQQVFDTAFNGVGVFTGGPHQGIQFGFTGMATESGGLTINRDVGIGIQTSTSAMFELVGAECVWRGLTTGPGIGPDGLPFEIRLPALIRTGSFPGVWHDHDVSLDFAQVFPGGQFNGVGVFTGGPHSGIDFGFSGVLSGTGGLRIDRDVGIGIQTAFAPTPQVGGGSCVWIGNTTGVGIPEPGLSFKLTVSL